MYDCHWHRAHDSLIKPLKKNQRKNKMIKETNTITFTKRLNYSVREVPVEEFLNVLSDYGKTEEDRKHVKTIQTKFYPSK